MLRVTDLRVSFGAVPAVRGVSFDVAPGEVFAVVGESGSGKSVTALGILGLLPAAEVSGRVEWRGEDLLSSPAAQRRVRGREIAMVFQDPQAALDPVRPVGAQVAEVVRVHEGSSRRAARVRAFELLDLVGIPDARRRASAYPHELSGGTCQRVVLALALAGRPSLLIADEPTTALDVTVQAQVLELLVSLRHDVGAALLLITHDLGVVAGIADRVLVMYAGEVVEVATADQLFYDTRHPYTAGLLASLSMTSIAGAPVSAADRPSGCAFHPRCPRAVLPGVCADVVPALRLVGHLSACHFAERLGAS
jgi:oligopeptide/dipeptide ABC transporter ATP-binding protein